MAIDINAVKRDVKNYANDVRRVFPIDKAFLYGSYAKGTADELSDVDVCFFISGYNGKTRFEISLQLFKLCEGYKAYIEPRVFETAEIERNNPFVNEIIRTGHEI